MRYVIFIKDDINDTRAFRWFCLVFMNEFEQISSIVPDNLLNNLAEIFYLNILHSSILDIVVFLVVCLMGIKLLPFLELLLSLKFRFCFWRNMAALEN